MVTHKSGQCGFLDTQTRLVHIAMSISGSAFNRAPKRSRSHKDDGWFRSQFSYKQLNAEFIPSLAFPLWESKDK